MMDILVISLLTLLPGLCLSDLTEKKTSTCVRPRNLACEAKAVQSSLHDPHGFSQNAVDGNRDLDYGKGSCTHTAGENNPWWRVDLKKVYSINRVTITNRGDCCGERLDGAQIRIGHSLDNNGNNNQLVATILTAPMGTETFEFSAINGRYVNIYLPGNLKYLTLCEVEVYAEQKKLPSTHVPRNLARGAKTVQSSLYRSYGVAQNAVDGNRDSYYFSRSCTHTAEENNPWWRVDLKKVYNINRVIITNRGDCCGERLDGAQIHIGNSLDNNGNNNQLAATILTAPMGTKTFRFSPIKGRYVNIYLPGNRKYLTLCEVEVYAEKKKLPSTCVPGNLACEAKAVQSSLYDPHGFAQNAVDSNRDSDYGKGSCTHTAEENNPWWRVDLNDVYSINRVIITNRGDTWRERLVGAQIRIGNSLNNNGNNNKIAVTVEAIPNGGTETFTFKPLNGRYVNIYLPGDRKILALCEVEVYAEKKKTTSTCVPGNLACEAKAVQSSLYDLLGFVQNAVDGNRDTDYGKGSCTHTAIENNPWWRVDLNNVYSINRVIITNRGDCCGERLDGAQIRIGNSLNNNGNNNEIAVTVESIPNGGTATFTFKPLNGRYVNIFLPGDQKILTLCEVEVYAGTILLTEKKKTTSTCVPGNLACEAKAVQSSLYDPHALAKNAVDGNQDLDYRKGSCTRTAKENNPWWRVDLNDVYSINRVNITNCRGCCEERLDGAQIRIGNSLDNNGNNNELAATMLTAPLGTETFEFSPIKGRYINIYLPGNRKYLTLCEVEVYAD